MKHPIERPILFSGPMVQAILNGEKTQTRRIAKPTRDRSLGCELAPHELAGELRDSDFRNSRFGKPGDRLWVKETTLKVEDHGYVGPVYAESDEGRVCISGGLAPSDDDYTEVEPWEIKRRPSIFMPRSMARILLEVVDVRVEKLCGITPADCIAEGAPGGHGAIPGSPYAAAPREHYRRIWESINGRARGMPTRGFGLLSSSRWRHEKPD